MPLARSVLRAGHRALSRVLPENDRGDRVFAFFNFVAQLGRLPSQRHLFNDALYRIKVNGEMSDPLRVFVTDKEFLKLFVRATVGEQHNVPTLGILRDPSALASFEFPAGCCIKPTHLSGHVILRRDGEGIDLDRMRGWFGMNHYRAGREANYRTLTPKVIVEPLIFGGGDVEDYKFFCVNGVPRLVQVDIDRYGTHRRKYFDSDWRDLPFSIGYPRDVRPFPRPATLEKMLDIASRLSERFPFVRVDLYTNGEEVLVGEITHCHDNAAARFIPAEGEQWASVLLFGDKSDVRGLIPLTV